MRVFVEHDRVVEEEVAKLPLNPIKATMWPRQVRIREDDQMTGPAKLKACRRTITIGETLYRCQLHHKDDLTTHVESGIIKRRGRKDVYYKVEWREDDKELRLRQ